LSVRWVAKGSVTSKYIHTLDTALIMAADTISGYIQGLLDGIEFKGRDSREAARARLPKRASVGDQEAIEEEYRLASLRRRFEPSLPLPL
jgi:hypothetical protein